VGSTFFFFVPNSCGFSRAFFLACRRFPACENPGGSAHVASTLAAQPFPSEESHSLIEPPRRRFSAHGGTPPAVIADHLFGHRELLTLLPSGLLFPPPCSALLAQRPRPFGERGESFSVLISNRWVTRKGAVEFQETPAERTPPASSCRADSGLFFLIVGTLLQRDSLPPSGHRLQVPAIGPPPSDQVDIQVSSFPDPAFLHVNHSREAFFLLPRGTH